MKRYALTLLLLLETALGASAGDPAPSPAEPGTAWNPYTALASAGVTFPLTYVGEVLGNPRGGYRQGAIYDGVLDAGIQLDLATLAHWPGASFAAAMYLPHGSSLTRADVHDLNVVSNIDAYHYPRLFQLWLEQDLFDGKLSIRVGQIPADADFFLTAYGSFFINSAFGALATISLNMEAPVYPAAAPGVRMIFKPDDHWALLAGVFDGSTGALDSADRNGTNFNFNPRNGALCLAEADYTTNPPPPAPADGKTTAPTERPLSGTCKLGGFLNTEDFTDIKTGGTLHGDYGLYAVVDQELWHKPGAPDEGPRGFLRLGFTPAGRNLLNFECECGCNYAGLVPGRDKDLTGLGFAYTKVSDGVPDNAGTAPARHYESIIELVYQAAVNDHLSVQPDLQYVFNPGGGAAPLANALVMGLRFTLTF